MAKPRPPYAKRVVGSIREQKRRRDLERAFERRAQTLALRVLAEALRPFLFPQERK